MTNEQKILAEQYINNELEGQELSAFEGAMQVDEELENYVHYLNKMKGNLKNITTHKATYDYIANLSQEDKIYQKKKRKKLIYSVLAISLLSILGFVIYSNINNGKIKPADDNTYIVNDSLENKTELDSTLQKDTIINIPIATLPKDTIVNIPITTLPKDTSNKIKKIPIAALTKADKSDLAIFQDKTMGSNSPESELWLKYFFNQEYDKALENMPSYVVNVDLESMKTEAFIIAGIIYLNSTNPDYEKAKEQLQVIIDENIDDYMIPAHWYLSVVYYYQNNPSEVKKNLDKVLKTNSKVYSEKAEKFETALMKNGFLK
jgi:hypothetical protein